MQISTSRPAVNIAESAQMLTSSTKLLANVASSSSFGSRASGADLLDAAGFMEGALPALRDALHGVAQVPVSSSSQWADAANSSYSPTNSFLTGIENAIAGSRSAARGFIGTVAIGQPTREDVLGFATTSQDAMNIAKFLAGGGSYA